MKRNKKGFTIVELVIVIAVIAILAAVLIPTFANLVKKANQSADVQAARQMDIALQAESAEEKPADFEAVIDILEEAGFDAEGSLKPITNDHTFYWFSTENAILLVNEEDADAPVVVYPDDEDVAEAFAAVTDAEDVLFDLEVGFLQYVEIEVESAEDVVAALSKGQSVTLTEDVELSQPISIPAGANTTIDLNGKTLTTAESGANKHHYAVQNNGGNVTIENGTFVSRGIMNNSGKITITDAVVNAVDTDGGGCIRNKKGSEVVIDGGTFNVVNYSSIENNYGGACGVHNDGGTVVINGGKFTSNTDAYLVINNSGTMTINGGEFTAYRGVLSCVGGTMTVNNGKFAVTHDSNSGWVAHTDGTGKIIINGGQFSSVANRMFTGDGIVNNINK